MPSVNEDLLDEAVQHQIDVQQMIASIVDDLKGTLSNGDDQILEEVLTQEASINDARSTKQWSAMLAALLFSIKVANRDAHAAMNFDFNNYIRDFVRYEADFQVNMLEETVKNVKKIIPE